MLRRDLGVDVTLESGPYGSFQVRVDDAAVVEGGALAFLGVLPSLDEIRTQVANQLDTPAQETNVTPDSRSAEKTPAGTLRLIEEGGVKVIEGPPGEHVMTGVEDSNLIVEACFSNDVRTALLYAENLTDDFFDLSSGHAGAVLQKLRNYGIRLAVVCPPGRVRFSSRFEEMLAEERRGRYFGVFETRGEALEWVKD